MRFQRISVENSLITAGNFGGKNHKVDSLSELRGKVEICFKVFTEHAKKFGEKCQNEFMKIAHRCSFQSRDKSRSIECKSN